MKNMVSKKAAKPLMALAGLAVAGAGFGLAALVSADTTANTTQTTVQTPGMGMFDHKGGPGVFGTVTAVSGTTLTVSSKNPKDSTTTIYTVDAGAAKILKGSSTKPAAGEKPAAPTTITIAGIAVGDTVMVRGTLTGTNVSATEIMDGMPAFGMRGPGGFGHHGTAGTITSVNGSTVTITAKDGTTYTIDASSAKLEKVSTISLGDLKIGDTISAEGELSGTTVTAKHIMDGAFPDGPKGL